MALLLKRLVLTLVLGFAIFVVLSSVLWAAGYFIQFTRVGQEPEISLNARPLGLIFFLVLVFSGWVSTRLIRRRPPERERTRRAA